MLHHTQTQERVLRTFPPFPPLKVGTHVVQSGDVLGSDVMKNRIAFELLLNSQRVWQVVRIPLLPPCACIAHKMDKGILAAPHRGGLIAASDALLLHRPAVRVSTHQCVHVDIRFRAESQLPTNLEAQLCM